MGQDMAQAHLEGGGLVSAGALFELRLKGLGRLGREGMWLVIPCSMPVFCGGASTCTRHQHVLCHETFDGLLQPEVLRQPILNCGENSGTKI